ncbi:MAG: hypothetical protein WA434_17585 [Candidatus Acidiferrales bacterium]
MNWLLKKLGYREREYRGADFHVRIEPIHRETVYVNYARDGKKVSLDGERIDRKREGISVYIPQEVDPARVSQISHDLEIALQAMDYSYIIARMLATEVVPEPERQAAIVELNAMGYEIEASPDREWFRQKRIEGSPRQDIETLRNQTARMLSLIQAIHGTRRRFEILARSKDFSV